MAGPSIHALIVSPEAKSRADLKKGLGAHPSVRVVEEFETWEAAGGLAQKKVADVIFSEPAEGKKGALDWIDEVPRTMGVVLLAPSARLAVQAFEKRVIDFLVKPVSPQRLGLTIDRLVEWKMLHARQGREARVDRKLMIQSRREMTVVRPQSIACIRAEGNYTSLLLQGGERKLVHRSLRQWRQILPEGIFFQIHRATLINLDLVKFVERKGGGKSLLHLQDHGEPLAVSRRLAMQLRHRLKTLRRA